jgi:hypothetical protein
MHSRDDIKLLSDKVLTMTSAGKADGTEGDFTGGEDTHW